MNFEGRTIAIGLAAFAATGLALSALVPFLAFRFESVSARLRARHFVRVRLMPAVIGAAVGLTTVAAFLAFESRKPQESVSPVVVALAVVGVFLIASALWRAVRLALATHRITNSWIAHGRPVALEGIAAPALAVSTPFPIVAVVGVFKPRLIIARSVLAACSEEELRAVIAHEQGHVTRRDNLRRLALTATPDLLAWTSMSARLFSAWSEASEEAADDESGVGQQDGRLHLASALVKVARLAAGQTAPPAILTTALYSGDDLDSRVRRLLAPATAVSARRIDALAFGALLAMALVVFATQAPAVHEWIEAVLHALP